MVSKGAGFQQSSSLELSLHSLPQVNGSEAVIGVYGGIKMIWRVSTVGVLSESWMVASERTALIIYAVMPLWLLLLLL